MPCGRTIWLKGWASRIGGLPRMVGLPVVGASLFLGASGAKSAHAQVVPPPPPTLDSVQVVPGEVYAASSLYRALIGDGYRDLWTTPIRVPVADMGALGGGGLTPIELGGGTTTQTLHLRGADGRRYVFRSVDKTPVELLEDLEGTRAEAIIKDQMSSFHPSGAVIMARLLDALGVLHPEPELMVVPDDPRLNEFREQFAGMLVLFEERPDDLPRGEAGFAGSTQIVQTDDLFDELEEGPENRLELRELLRTRLLDILAGDRDRSVNNHLWARFEDGNGYLWRPIPRDRDQSFVQFDGILKGLARQYDYRLVPFRDDYANTEAVTRNAWDIDRNFLVALDRAAWDATVREVIAALTDEVIGEAVSEMPPEHYAIIGAELEDRLRVRRQALPGAAEEFYDVVFRFADIHGTDVDENALLESAEDGSVRVALYRSDGSAAPTGPPYFDRTFSPQETREVRVYMHGGDDRIEVRGNFPSSIKLRVVGGGGADALANSGQTPVTFYDGGGQTTVEGARVDHVEDSPSRPFSWFEDSYDLDWGGQTRPLPSMSYDSDRGLVPILGLQHTGFGFAKLPYSRRFSLRGGWAFGHGTPIVESSLLMRRILGRADLRLDGLFSGIQVVNFFGLGNETDSDSPDEFYEVDQEQLLLSASLGIGDGESWEASVGPVFKRVVSDTTGVPTFLSETRPLGTEATSQWGLLLDAALDRRDFVPAPVSGYRIEGGAGYYAGVSDLEEGFGFARVEAATYLSPAGGNPTLAVRVGGKKLWGDFPYYEAAFVGGGSTVRGLDEERFAGDAALYGSAELRVFLARLTFLLPVEMGAFIFGDAGRVFLEGASDEKWHAGRGAGVWLAPLSRSGTVRLSVGSSEGRTSLYLGMGFAY